MNSSRFSLIVISPPEDLPQETAVLTELFKLGLELYHLRKPSYTSENLSAYLEKLPEQCMNRIVLHSHYEIAGRFHISRFHGSAAEKLKPNSIYSCSVHSLKEAGQVKNDYEYEFLSPIFNSISKPEYKAVFEMDELQTWLSKNKRAGRKPEIIALGGVCPKNIQKTRNMGFDGAAVLGAVWQNGSRDAVRNFTRLKDALCAIPIH